MGKPMAATIWQSVWVPACGRTCVSGGETWEGLAANLVGFRTLFWCRNETNLGRRFGDQNSRRFWVFMLCVCLNDAGFCVKNDAVFGV
jgi:hypothetical protein